jgi:branched-chain amino acid transport system ATP-binding protein
MTDLLAATGLTKGYGKIPVLKSVDLTVRQGEVHVVIGPNGAGKSTLLKVLSGELFPDQGRITFAGQDVTPFPGWRRAAMGFGRTFQVARIFAAMTVLANLIVAVEAATARAHPRLGLLGLRPRRDVRDRAEALMDEMALRPVGAQMAGALSHGDKKRLELAMTLALRPRLLLLDEPTAGMSTADRAACVALLARIVRDHGVTLLLTEHDLGVVFGLGTRLTVLNYGEIVASGDPQMVRHDPMVKQVYLGHGNAAA